MNPEKIRKVYAPYSTTGEQVGQTPLTGYVDVAQAIYPAVNTGQVSVDGEWSGITVSDKTFTIDATHEAIPNGAAVLSPQKANADFIDMTGFSNLFIAIKPSNGGNVAIEAVMGPDTNTFANLTPVNAAATLRGSTIANSATADMANLFGDSTEALTANVWNIFVIQENLQGQKNMQFKLTNNSGGNSDITFAYLRVV
tara:strand:- start:779 stop:1372 length:594 start_codon:yes stop_codon:yes gene_type:complete